MNDFEREMHKRYLVAKEKGLAVVYIGDIPGRPYMFPFYSTALLDRLYLPKEEKE